MPYSFSNHLNKIIEKDHMNFFMITNDPDIAKFVSQNGVSRILVDLEFLGKDKRQKNMDTWKSNHSLADVSRVRKAVPNAHLLVRVNPMNENSKEEINEVLSIGAQSVMLPMFRSVDEVNRFFDLLNGRAEGVPLVETADALLAIPSMIDHLPIKRLHFGLNDLYLDLKLNFIFEPLTNGLLDEPAKLLREKGVRFGIGGIARANEGLVNPKYIISEHVRLGSDAAILSRTLHRGAKTLDELKKQMDFSYEINLLQDIYSTCKGLKCDELEMNRQEIVSQIKHIVNGLNIQQGLPA